jgi:hypothetical protein
MLGKGTVSASSSSQTRQSYRFATAEKKKSPRFSGGLASHVAVHQLSTGFQSPSPRQRASPLLWEESHEAIRTPLYRARQSAVAFLNRVGDNPTLNAATGCGTCAGCGEFVSRIPLADRRSDDLGEGQLRRERQAHRFCDLLWDCPREPMQALASA